MENSKNNPYFYSETNNKLFGNKFRNYTPKNKSRHTAVHKIDDLNDEDKL